MLNVLIPEIAVFIRITELGSLTAVAAQTGYSSSGISRMVTRLEDSLGVKLLLRSTRSLGVTPEGELFLKRAREILAILESAEAEISRSSGQPAGRLLVNCGTAFAHHKLAPLLPRFIARYPKITVDLSVSDRRIDPVADRIDVTIRVGALKDSDLIAVRLGTVRRIIAASPDYLAARGTPVKARDLRHHDCLLLTGFPNQAVWPIYDVGKRLDIPVTGSIACDSADALLQAAIGGGGLIRLGDFLGAGALASGLLVPVLTDCHFDDPQPLTALVVPGRQSIPRIRAFLDFLKEAEVQNPRKP